MRNLFYLVVVLWAAATAQAQEAQKSTLEDQTSVEVTVYNSNIGLVKDRRSLTLPKGGGELRFMDVAASIMPETVHISSVNQPNDFRVLEQNYEYDLMNSQKMLDKFVGRNIKLLNSHYDETSGKTVDEVTPALLLSNNNGEQIFQINGEIHLNAPGYRILPEVPSNLIAQPTLMWLYQNSASKAHDVEVTYLAHGINWRADYVVVLNKTDDRLGLNGWVTLDNNTGTMYKDARLKLVAGAVNRVQPQAVMYKQGLARAELAMDAAAPQFEEKSFFEYHIYDLQRPATIKNNQQKQISLLEAAEVPVQKQYVVKGGQQYYWSNYMNAELTDPVQVILRFRNDKDSHMGMPLPEGTMRLYKEDDAGSLQFIGEDRIEHTPKDEWLELKVGDAFDVTAKRKQLDYRETSRLLKRSFETEWEISLYNHKDEDIVVYVDESMLGAEWEVIKSSHPYTKEAAFHLRFAVPVPKDREVKLTYRVRYEQP